MKDITILFVDDEQHILRALERSLVKEPYRKRFAASGREALAILAREPVHVIVCDMKMPEMDGLQLLLLIREQYPHIVRLVFSGFAALEQVLHSIRAGEVYRYIAKPLDPQAFKQTLRDAISAYLARRERPGAPPCCAGGGG